uniref:Uncharacterized protein n=1 Tax=Ananas comosus var. bracteatus TaxID=296719 RepID=A0A6V7QDI9_ANACO|nr:unnamed protein product [Ananas comosus var. bracteatus]
MSRWPRISTSPSSASRPTSGSATSTCTSPNGPIGPYGRREPSLGLWSRLNCVTSRNSALAAATGPSRSTYQRSRNWSLSKAVLLRTGQAQHREVCGGAASRRVLHHPVPHQVEPSGQQRYIRCGMELAAHSQRFALAREPNPPLRAREVVRTRQAHLGQQDTFFSDGASCSVAEGREKPQSQRLSHLLHLYYHCYAKLPQTDPSRIFALLQCHISRRRARDPFPLVNNSTLSLFTNLVAFEQCSGCEPEEAYMTSYATFMNCIIDTPRDVAILQQSGILENQLASDMDLAVFFNEFSNCPPCITAALPRRIVPEVREYCNSDWHNWKAKLVRTISPTHGPSFLCMG